MFSLSPFGIVRIAPDFTITFAGVVKVDPRVQLDGTVQSPDKEGPQERDCSAESTLIRGKERPLPGLVIDFPVVFSADKIVDTEAEGFFCFRIAHAPVTAGAAKEVPLPTEVPPPGTDEVTDSPGARRERKDALFVKDDTWSESFVEPTLIALDTHAGELNAFTNPLFPEDTIVAIPTDWSVSNSDLY